MYTKEELESLFSKNKIDSSFFDLVTLTLELRNLQNNIEKIKNKNNPFRCADAFSHTKKEP